LVLDAGTTRMKAYVFDDKLNLVIRTVLPMKKKILSHGRVEQSPEEMITSARAVIRAAYDEAAHEGVKPKLFGITNQRETVVAWEKNTLKPIGPAIVWEDSRTKELCAHYHSWSETVRKKTGLPIDSYFSATKMLWLLDNDTAVAVASAHKNLSFGTVDSWLLANLAEGAPHLTDTTNASRTLLLDAPGETWDLGLCGFFRVPVTTLPKVQPSVSNFGYLKHDVCGAILKVCAIAGDQQASLAAISEVKGTTKITFGTGAFLMQSLGADFKLHPGFMTTRLATTGKICYGLEAKIEGTGAMYEEVRADEEKSLKVLKRLSEELKVLIAKLPLKPKLITIDGGMVQDERLASILEKTLKIKVVNQTVPDGTALGIAKLLSKSL